MTELSKRSDSNLTLKQRLELKKSTPCLLLDVSGSMASDVEPGKRKIDALRDIVSDISPRPVMYYFSDSCERVAGEIPEPISSTMMSRAISRAKKDGYSGAIMVTDGEATDKDAALLEVKGFKLRILYVGPGPKPKFLDDLAAASAGGFCTLEDLKQPKQLSEKLTLLLEGPKGPGAIQL